MRTIDNILVLFSYCNINQWLLFINLLPIVLSFVLYHISDMQEINGFICLSQN